ncbi:serine palmitoyltransferase 2 [Diaphorina citri]|uniref:serine C-palmitoyltransferase n=1 Tax=Diaphorina citri TaxID=121845 RepID=A0A3Q0JE15_DIACI|nr:serine palmitoyltransferase 2 [Diaphorina citri]
MARNGLLKSHSTTKPANGYIFENGTKTLWTQGESTQEKTNAHTNGFANGISKSNGLLSSNGVSSSAPNGGPPINEDPPLYPRKWAENFESVPYMTAILTFFGFYLLMIMGYINYLLFVPNVAKEKNREGYPDLYEKFVLFYSRYVYRRIVDCFNRPVTSVPGAIITIKDRETPDYGWTFKYTGTESTCLNLASYNYLGFGENTGLCTERSKESVKQSGCALCSPSGEIVQGILVPIGHNKCNKMNDKSRYSTFSKENLYLTLSFPAPSSLEAGLQKALLEGQPHSGKPWRKILIVVEGIFSMDGSIVRLPEIVRLKNKYKAYLYVDEAHSIGALGPTGRGVTEYFGIDPREVDILMGTYTKSFGSMGGYVAGSKSTIDYIRANSHVRSYATSMPPPVAMQILTSMRIIMGLENGDEGNVRHSSI